ncbi:hypothetical protein [Colwellia psychrerythraea]|nr:hypothetical protein [Colwellia psychrerythraea]
MIRKIFCRYTAWYEFELTKTNAVLAGYGKLSLSLSEKNCFVSVLVGEYE